MTRARDSLRRIAAIARKEFRHLRRDRLTGGMVAGIPVMMTLLFGYAINQDVRHLRAGVADLSGSQRGRILALDAEATQVIDIVETAGSAEELETLLRRGEIVVGILIPADFEQRAGEPDRAAAQLLVDGGDPVVFAAARSLAQLPLPTRAGYSALRAPSPALEVRAYYNPERRSPVHIVPAICGVILTLTMVLFTAVAIVREKERGNLELLITTPVKTLELMIGKIAPFVAVGFLQVSIIIALGTVLFRIPLRGSVVDFYLGAGVFVLATLTLGLLISTVATTQFQAFQMSFVSFLPQILLSGFMFPFDGMPRAVQFLAEAFPLTHFIRINRGVMLRGAAFEEVWPDVWPLMLFFVITLSLSVLRFRKRLD